MWSAELQRTIIAFTCYLVWHEKILDVENVPLWHALCE